MAQLSFEHSLRNAPNAGELAQVTDMVKANKADLDEARRQVSELRAEAQKLGLRSDAQQGQIESLSLDIKVKSKRILDLDAARKIAERQVQELMSSAKISERNKEAEVRHAVREGKREVAEAYNKILLSVKEKFSKKKEEVDLMVYAHELQANTELLKEFLNNEISDANAEYNRLMAFLPGATADYEKSQVSDFSISKLPLPQLSENSGMIEINMFNPSFSGEYGSNLGPTGFDLAPVEATPSEGKEMEGDLVGNEGRGDEDQEE